MPAYLPRWLLLPLIALYFGWEKRTVRPPDVPIEDLVPLQRFDGLLVEELDSSLQTFAGMSAEVLLMGGRRGPAFLREILDALEGTFCGEDPGPRSSQRHRSGQVGLGRRFAPDEQPVIEWRR